MVDSLFVRRRSWNLPGSGQTCCSVHDCSGRPGTRVTIPVAEAAAKENHGQPSALASIVGRDDVVDEHNNDNDDNNDNSNRVKAMCVSVCLSVRSNVRWSLIHSRSRHHQHRYPYPGLPRFVTLVSYNVAT